MSTPIMGHTSDPISPTSAGSDEHGCIENRGARTGAQDRHTTLLALFWIPVAYEGDPERAVRAGWCGSEAVPPQV
jgi:hypothetical protein